MIFTLYSHRCLSVFAHVQFGSEKETEVWKDRNTRTYMHSTAHALRIELDSLPGFTRALVLRPIRKCTNLAFSALSDWSDVR